MQGAELRCDRNTEPESDPADGSCPEENRRRYPVREAVHERRDRTVSAADDGS